MTARFAELESRVNAAAIAHCSNATATLPSAALVDGEFDENVVDAFGLVKNEGPTFKALASALSTLQIGNSITINATAYTVAAIYGPDSGMTLLALKP